MLYHVQKDFCSNQGDTMYSQDSTTQDDTTQAQDDTTQAQDNTIQDNLTQDNVTQSNVEDATSLDDSIALVVRHPIKVKDIIKSLQKKQWLRWFRSAKNINTFIPIFEKITKVVEGIQCINCRPFCELLGDVKSLRASLIDIEKRVLGLEAKFGLSASVLLAIGSVVCLVVGGILIFTPAAIALAIAGAAGVGTSFVIGGSTKLCCYLSFKCFNHSLAKGEGKGDKFVMEDATELDTS